jgi:hypothetical protein
MLKRVFPVFLLFTVFTSWIPSAVMAAERIEDIGLDLSLGYRVDQFDWSIAGNSSGTNPNILSELNWSNLGISQLQVDGWLESRDLLWLKTNTLLIANIAYGKIFAGDNRDSDYVGDNRTDEWSRSINQSEDGFTLDLSGAVGPEYDLTGNRMTLTPLVGYSFHIQHLSMTDGVQTVSDDVLHDSYPFFDPADGPVPLGPFPGLDNTYTAYWWGPWLGLQLQISPVDRLSFELTGEYHWVEYFAEADWNLRTNLAHPVSFEHEAHGSGLVVKLKSAYDLNQRWTVVFSGNVQFWETGDGVDTTYFADGTRGGTRLNEVNRESYALMVGLRHHF